MGLELELEAVHTWPLPRFGQRSLELHNLRLLVDSRSLLYRRFELDDRSRNRKLAVERLKVKL